MTNDPKTVTLNDVRFSYCNLFQPRPPMNDPNGKAKYSATILISKNNTAAKAAMDAAIAAAIDAGVANPRCWNGVRPPVPSICVHDGDGTRPSDGAAYGDECRGCWIFTASTAEAPFIVDGNLQAIIDPRECYSGMYGNVSVTFYPYSNTKKGVGCALNGIQKTRDGEPLGGAARITAEEAFQPVAQPQTAATGYPAPAPAMTQQAAAYPAPAQWGAPITDPYTGEVLGYPQQGPYAPAGFPVMGV